MSDTFAPMTIAAHIKAAEAHLLAAEQFSGEAGPEGHLKLAEIHLELCRAKHHAAASEFETAVGGDLDPDGRFQ